MFSLEIAENIIVFCSGAYDLPYRSLIILWLFWGAKHVWEITLHSRGHTAQNVIQI